MATNKYKLEELDERDFAALKGAAGVERDAAFLRLLAVFRPCLSAMAGRLARNRSDRPDLVQAGSLALLRTAQRYRQGRGRFENYARRAIRHAMLDEVARDARQTRPTLVKLTVIMPEDVSADVIRREVRAIVQEEIASWEKRLRTIAERIYWDGLRQVEVARELNLTPARVNQLLQEVHARGREEFAPFAPEVAGPGVTDLG